MGGLIMIWTALTIGFLGSFHCIGMCGPLAMAAATHSGGGLNGRISYSIGRLLTYMSLGALAGGIGHVFLLSGWQRTLSISAGGLLLVMAVLSKTTSMPLGANSVLNHWTASVKQGFKRVFGSKSRWTPWFFGLLNGLLPCGFVYLAMVAAATTAEVGEGAFYMLAFGLGTWPAMITVSYAGHWFGPKISRWVEKGSSWVAVVVAILLIYRGFNTDIATCCRPHG